MILAIVQARCSSSRLPGKVLQPILGKPMILHELERLKRSRCIDRIVLATSCDSSDDALAETVGSVVDVYRGSLDDVLDRYYQCAQQMSGTTIVRITGDCPVIDWNIVDEAIQKHQTEGNDYTSLDEHYPDGLDTEVFRFPSLKRSCEEAKLPSEREHVTQYMRKHPELFKLGTVCCIKDMSSVRWTVDEPEDLELIRQIYAELYPKKPDFTAEDIGDLMEKCPDLKKINFGIERNEGLTKSLNKDERWMQEHDGGEK